MVDVTKQQQDRPPLVVVDAANVVGSVPDGWWRDRAGATTRLRDELAPIAAEGLRPLPGTPEWATHPPLETILVVEGKARNVPGTDEVQVIAATASGDDTIVDVVREYGADRPCVVITADRGLRARVIALGAQVLGPRSVRS